MRRLLVLPVLAVALAIAVAAGAENKDAKAAKAAPKSTTLKGELVDMGCYVSHEARGEKHKGCAMKCVAGGMPIGLLTADNKLYLLTPNHDNADPYNMAKELMSAMVEVTGTVSERGGARILDVTEVKASATAVTK